MPVNESLYEQSQRLADVESATYENVLFNDNVVNFLGTFTCEVSNIRGTDEVTRELNGLLYSIHVALILLHKIILYEGVSTARDLLIVGESATARCISDTPAIRIEWLNEENVLITSTTSAQQLDLVFSLVNDSIHNQVYVCRVTGHGGVITTQNITVHVTGKI